MKNNIQFFAVIFSVLVLVSCKEKENYKKMPLKEAKATSNVHKIVVKETLNGGGYTYLNVNEEGNSYWMAIPNTPVTIGETYFYEGGMVMKNFESKELNKTFDFITFSEGIRTTEVAKVVKQKNPHTNSEVSKVEEVIKIEKPKNGTSLNELFSAKKTFSAKTIIVKGNVIKVNNGIMSKNWVHISDGTQFEGEKSLTVTTLETVKVGDVITFKGIIILDKDFGQGYVYPILMEEGEIIK
ncbi:MAG: DNA-binding protein [Lutibacter sp.]|uniref:hypothetical protein n=1 Tax=Lutibacter sp. TaxID=1925666 RepID=UPI001A015828|nr:hypothetical protein [Lutibacter sp.]NOR28988.1 DNA-binding protein [Lutibacter sp.]